jgi:hypothetical protein
MNFIPVHGDACVKIMTASPVTAKLTEHGPRADVKQPFARYGGNHDAGWLLHPDGAVTTGSQDLFNRPITPTTIR